MIFKKRILRLFVTNDIVYFVKTRRNMGLKSEPQQRQPPIFDVWKWVCRSGS